MGHTDEMNSNTKDVKDAPMLIKRSTFTFFKKKGKFKNKLSNEKQP